MAGGGGGAAVLDFSGDGGGFWEGARMMAVEVDPSWSFPSRSIRDAYIVLQTWKRHAMFSDPRGLTADWAGPDVCNYTGIYCAPLPSDPHVLAVVGVDLNHGDIAGYLPPELGLLADLALLHLNSNRFCGVLPDVLCHLRVLHEFDLSNNRFVGKFPKVVQCARAMRLLCTAEPARKPLSASAASALVEEEASAAAVDYEALAQELVHASLLEIMDRALDLFGSRLCRPHDLPVDKGSSKEETKRRPSPRSPANEAAGGAGSWMWSPVSWFRMLVRELHWSFMLGVVAMYGISHGLGGGMKHIALDYYWKDAQKVQPSAAQVSTACWNTPWS